MRAGSSSARKTQVKTYGAALKGGAFAPLIDAKAASMLLGVPYTWLLAQARAGKIPHHRLGHYVCFDPGDLQNMATRGTNRREPRGPTLETTLDDKGAAVRRSPTPCALRVVPRSSRAPVEQRVEKGSNHGERSVQVHRHWQE